RSGWIRLAMDGFPHHSVHDCHSARERPYRTGKGIAANAKQYYPFPFVLVLVCLLVMANTINIAADLAAMGEALYLVVGGLKHEHALIFAASSVLLQVFVPYRRHAPILKFLTLVLFVYIAVAFTVEIPLR